MKKIICVAGLGYVGLPLAVEFSKAGFEVIGFDINPNRINQLKISTDQNNETTSEELKNTSINFTTDPVLIKKADYIIVAVPTPITDDDLPDLEPIRESTITIGKNLKNGSTVIYESTVYPGVTEEICIPLLEQYSHLKCIHDFNVGYSPERINPGDKEHTIGKIKKIVSGITPACCDDIAKVYGKIIKAGICKAKNIKIAETAKVLENTQRDINIALMNELALICDKVGIETRDVIEAASTKWNFQKYYPGLVGGHCISVDPHYLLFKAKELGYSPKVILAGREVNEFIAVFIANQVMNYLEKKKIPLKEAKVLVSGITFKDNVKDTRNSKSVKIIKILKEKGMHIAVYDPMLTKQETANTLKMKDVVALESLKEIKGYDVLVICTASKSPELTLAGIKEMLKPNSFVFDVKWLFRREEIENLGFIYKAL